MKRILFVLIVLVLTACNIQTPVATATPVPATATLVSVTATPLPATEVPVPVLPGKLIFWGAYDVPNMHMLDLTMALRLLMFLSTEQWMKLWARKMGR